MRQSSASELAFGEKRHVLTIRLYVEHWALLRNIAVELSDGRALVQAVCVFDMGRLRNLVPFLNMAQVRARCRERVRVPSE